MASRLSAYATSLRAQSRTSFRIPTQFDELSESDSCNNLLQLARKGTSQDVSQKAEIPHSSEITHPHLMHKPSLSHKKMLLSSASSSISSSGSSIFSSSTQKKSHATAHAYGRTFMSFQPDTLSTPLSPFNGSSASFLSSLSHSLPSPLLSSSKISSSATSSWSVPRSASRSLSEVLQKYPVSSHSTLSSGLQVVTEHTNEHSVTVGVFIHAGSRFERKEENGVAHFAEHMLFKGTDKRTRQQLEREIENLGAQLEAFTTREMTAIYIKARSENINGAIDILGDIICNSSVSPLAVEEEKLTIIREMEAVGESIRGTIMDELHGTAFHDQPIGQPILGTHEKVRKLSASSIQSYLHTHFRADRMFVVAVGAVEHEKVLSSVENAFANIPTSRSAPKHKVNSNNHAFNADSIVEIEKKATKFVGSMMCVENPYTPLSHFAYAYETAGWTDPDHVVLHCYRFLLDSYVKGNSNARFSSNPYISTMAVRDLAESFTTFHSRYSDTGLFGVYSVHGMDVTREGTRVSCENFLKHTSYCSQEDLDEAKRKLQLSALSFLDGTTATCEDIGRQLIMTGRRMHPLEILQRIDEIDVTAIHRVGKRFFHRDPVLTLVGPTFDLPSYDWWKNRSFLRK